MNNTEKWQVMITASIYSKYKIARAKNASLNEQIRILEEYKEKEFTERWSYELAKLYYKAGDKQKCLDLCNEMIPFGSMTELM